MIKISKVTKQFRGTKQPALTAIDLAVEPGDIYGIIGQSGAGKSTLIRCLTLLERPSSGEIYINGLDVTKLSEKELCEARKSFGMVFQNFNLLQSRTVELNVAFPLEISGLDKKKIELRVDELLEMVGLSHKKNAYPSQLSGGEKQRVGIARALANGPSLLLCDEATSALDPQSTASILSLLKSLGLTILLITHEMDVVKAICNKVAVIEQGRIVEQGLVTDVFSKPMHLTTKNFLAHTTHSLPDQFKDPSKCLLRLCFHGSQAKEPLISRLCKSSAIHVNILLGGLDCIDNTIIGNLVVELLGTKQEVEDALLFLKNNHVDFDLL